MKPVQFCTGFIFCTPRMFHILYIDLPAFVEFKVELGLNL